MTLSTKNNSNLVGEKRGRSSRKISTIKEENKEDHKKQQNDDDFKDKIRQEVKDDIKKILQKIQEVKSDLKEIRTDLEEAESDLKGIRTNLEEAKPVVEETYPVLEPVVEEADPVLEETEPVLEEAPCSPCDEELLEELIEEPVLAKKCCKVKPLVNENGDYLNPLTNRYVKFGSSNFKKLLNAGIIKPVELDNI